VAWSVLITINMLESHGFSLMAVMLIMQLIV
jgi:hypothetical protein